GLPPSLAAELMIPVVRALACAHEHGIVHCDLKPSNVFLTDAGVVKVLDFGIAQLRGEGREGARRREHAGKGARASRAEPSSNSTTSTTASALAGTGPYMTPEQWAGGVVDAQTDVWAAGILMAELLLGRHPLSPLDRTSVRSIRDLDVPIPSVRMLRQ